MLRRVLCDQSPADSGGNSGPTAGEGVSPSPSPASSPKPEPPKAAKTVLEGKTEGELKAERERDQALAEKKKVEIRCSELEDENHQLKQIPTTTPAPKKKKHWSDPVWD